MRHDRSEEPALRQLRPDDCAVAAQLADRVFRVNPFYTKALGLDVARFTRYWNSFFKLALDDCSAAVYAFELNGRILAALAVVFDGFPRPTNGCRFLLTLLWQLGPRYWIRYVRFAIAYGRVMARPKHERKVEARGLWLFVDPTASEFRLGSRLVRNVTSLVHCQGKLLLTGFVDVENRPLLSFYRHLGFSISPPFQFGAMRAATVERHLDADAPPR